MPFEIIFFGLLFIFNIFYGTNKKKVAFLIGLMLSFLSEINVLDLQINNVYFNLFSMILVCLIALVKFNYKNINLLDFLIVLVLMFVYLFLLKSDVFNAIQFGGMAYIVCMFFVVKFLRIKSFINISISFLILSEFANLVVVKSIVGSVVLFSNETIMLAIFAIIIDYLFDVVIKTFRKREQNKYV